MSDSQMHEQFRVGQLLPVADIFGLVCLDHCTITFDLVLSPVTLILPAVGESHPSKPIDDSTLPAAFILTPIIELHGSLAMDLPTLEVTDIQAIWRVNNTLAHLVFVGQESASIKGKAFLV